MHAERWAGGRGRAIRALTLTVNVASTAPASVTNTATVSGGGETNTGNDTATDVTAISVAGVPDLPPDQDAHGDVHPRPDRATYTLTVTNAGTAGRRAGR